MEDICGLKLWHKDGIGEYPPIHASIIYLMLEELDRQYPSTFVCPSQIFISTDLIDISNGVC